MMVNYGRKAAGLMAVWAVFLGVIMVWPNAPSARATGPDQEFAGAGDTPGAIHDLNQETTYVHTGLWVADVQADGTVVYLRQIKRR
tara:strand:+ start:190327 stop:190584 length:258 start_codon:yes stop_codon:yes gene_type:complete